MFLEKVTLDQKCNEHCSHSKYARYTGDMWVVHTPRNPTVYWDADNEKIFHICRVLFVNLSMATSPWTQTCDIFGRWCHQMLLHQPASRHKRLECVSKCRWLESYLVTRKGHQDILRQHPEAMARVGACESVHAHGDGSGIDRQTDRQTGRYWIACTLTLYQMHLG